MKTETLLYLLVSIVCGFAATLANTEDELIEELVEVIEEGLKKEAGRIIRNRKSGIRSLACPRAPRYGPIPVRTEKACRRHRQCEDGERCCDWADTKHCLKGIAKKQRLGRCPKITQVNDMCYAEGARCRYDNECPGEDEKCCLNPGCGYKDCMSIRQNLACPVPKSLVMTERTEANCTKETECGIDEKCCEWSGSKHCLKGISTIPKPGPCISTAQDPDSHCIADLPSCDYDSECSGINEKCCYNSNCHYTECIDMNKYFVCPDVDLQNSTKDSTCSTENNTCEGFGKVCCATAQKETGEGIYECVEGLYQQPKPGRCPAAAQLSFPGEGCLEDYEGGCQYDDDCFGRHKCCETSCGYNECVRVRKAEEQNAVERIIRMLTEEK